MTHRIQYWGRKLLRDRSHWNMSMEAPFNAVLHSDQCFSWQEALGMTFLIGSVAKVATISLVSFC